MFQIRPYLFKWMHERTVSSFKFPLVKISIAHCKLKLKAEKYQHSMYLARRLIGEAKKLALFFIEWALKGTTMFHDVLIR